MATNISTSQNFKPLPILFLGHGSPMNAIEDNEFSRTWRELGKSLPKPEAVLCISAHWETRGSFITAMDKPRTIHDFGGFPKALYEVEYPALGSLEFANEIKAIVKNTNIELDFQWGLDHGCWSVLTHIYPKADIPVFQISLDHYQTPLYHYELAKELASLRRKGILIIGSGNIVHNLILIDWNNPTGGYDWAEIANNKMKKLISENDHQQLIQYKSLGSEVEIAIPTPEHYLPMLYILAMKEENEKITFLNDKLVMGSLSMTSFIIGKPEEGH